MSDDGDDFGDDYDTDSGKFNDDGMLRCFDAAPHGSFTVRFFHITSSVQRLLSCALYLENLACVKAP